MTTQPYPNKYITKAMQKSIHALEQNGFHARRIMPIYLISGIHAREFQADFAKQTPTGLLECSVRIDIYGNVTIPKP